LKKTGIIFKRDFRELRQTNTFLIISIVFSVVTIAIAASVSIVLSKKEWIGQKAAEPILELIIGLIAYFLPLAILMTFIWAFSSLPVVKEKVNGNITSLIATTLTPKEIWLGKSLAIFIPGYAISIVSTMIVLIAVNLFVIVPATGDFLLPLPLFLVSLVWNPLLLLGLLLFIILFSLANNPDIAITPSFLVGFSLMMGIPLGMASGVINLTSWSFSLWYLAGVIIVWIIVFILTRLLTKENIILSSKGG
jgi:ABC-type transport system involved in multi-copper enzyme maturation permease subunit